MSLESITNIRFLYKNVKIDQRTEEYITKRVQTIDKLIDNILQVEVEIERDKKGLFRVELMIKTPKDLYRSEEQSESIEGSADVAVDQMKNQVSRKKNKVWTKIIRGARSIKKKLTIDKDARFK